MASPSHRRLRRARADVSTEGRGRANGVQLMRGIWLRVGERSAHPKSANTHRGGAWLKTTVAANRPGPTAT